MGGLGSGRHWRFNSRDTVEDCRSLDVRRWQRDGLLSPGNGFNWQWSRNGETMANIGVGVEAGQLSLTYRVRLRKAEEWESVVEPVLLETTPGTFGGLRYWFLCPAIGCGRRVALLYGHGKYFACRRCYRLVYPSTREDRANRATRRADKLRSRLGWEPGILNGEGLKPKWMRWRTFQALRRKHDNFVAYSLRSMRAKFGRFGEEFDF